MRRIRFRWYWPIVAAFLVLMSVNAARLLRAEPPTKPRAGDVAKAERTAAPPPGTTDEREPLPPPATVSGNGVVEPAQPETRAGASLPGRIAQILVSEGQTVAAGDVLVVFENAVEEAAVTAAKAEVEAAKAQLTRALRGNRNEDIQAAVADAETAQARADLSRAVSERLERVATGGGATMDEVDRARRQAEADSAAAKAAAARRQSVLAGSRREDIQLSRAQLAAAEARQAQAQAVLERLTVRAPIAGEVLQIGYRAGEYYQPGGDPLVVLGNTSKLRVRLDVDERDVGRVYVGASVIVRANAFPGVDFSGSIVEIGRRMGRKNVRTDDPTERNDTKILEVVVLLDDPSGLVVGQRVTGYVKGREPTRQSQSQPTSTPAP